MYNVIVYMSSMLQSAVGWEYQSELSKHGSQTDATKGFGGRYGVQKDRQDDVSVIMLNLWLKFEYTVVYGYQH